VTVAAGAYLASPPWVAIIEQVPAAILVRMLPEIVQTPGVVDTRLTVKSELAVALIENEGLRESNVTLPRGPKVIVCDNLTAKLWVTGTAAAYVAFPP
jgi:hypothetical protein